MVYQTDNTINSNVGLYYFTAGVGWKTAGHGASPGGVAGGDLTGTYPNPTIASGVVTPAKLGTAGASSGDVLTFNGSTAQWSALPSGGTYSAGNGISITANAIALKGSDDINFTGLQTFSNIDVNGGFIDGAAIGDVSRSTGKFTSLSANGGLTVGGGATVSSGGIEVTGLFDLKSGGYLRGDIEFTGNNFKMPNLTGGTGDGALFITAHSAAGGGEVGRLGTTNISGVVSSINSSMAKIDAARIGNGLTNAQVENDLTVTGGIINNTPIGNTTRNTGKFTSLEAESVRATGALIIPTATTDPVNPANGTLYYNTSTAKLRIFITGPGWTNIN
jgi:hypothetical protein